MEGGLRTKGIKKENNRERKLVSVVTVVFNGKKTLAKTIKSVIRQEYENFEYIIVDGGSNDGTIELIKTFEDKIDYWISEKDDGIYDAMNKGIAFANGEIVHLLNADDIYVDIDILSRVATDMENTDFLSTRVLYEMSHKSKILKMSGNKLHSIPHPGLFVKKSFYEKTKYNTSYKYAADRDFFLRIPSASAVKKTGYVSTKMIAGGFGGTDECRKESNAIYRKNGIYMHLIFTNLKAYLKKILIRNN